MSFTGFKPDWRKESPTYIRSQMQRHMTELDGLRYAESCIHDRMREVEADIADMAYALMEKGAEDDA